MVYLQIFNYQNIELHNYGYPNEAAAIADTVVRLPDMMKFYSQVTGVEYPYSSYSQVSIQDVPWGMANNSFSLQTENMIDDDRTHADFFYLWDALEAENLANQWFGNYLTCRDWSQIWLNKGFGHYFDGLYNEYKNGREEFLIWQVLANHNTYLADWNAGYRHPIVTRNYPDTLNFITDNYAYSRGAAVLHMLRKHLGEERWWNVIKHYIRANGGKLVSTEDLRRSVEEVSGEPMDWFFEQWLYKMGHPIFEVTKTYDAVTKQLTLNVKQRQTPDANDEYPQVEYFQGKVEVEIDGRIESIWLVAQAENSFTFSCDQAPKLVNFDYESTWIKELKFEKSFDELLYQFEQDRDLLGRRWAMNTLVNLAKDQAATKEVKDRIYTALRNTALSGSYWRLRLNAISQLQSLIAPATETNPIALDQATTTMLLTVIKNEQSWLRATAISFLGMTRDEKYVDLYIEALNDQSDRVINTAAAALGKSKSPRAFDALAKLVNRPSWKNQSLMSALNGLKILGDPRGFEIANKALSDPHLLRWRLPVPPVWDYRVIATETLVALGRAEAAYPLILARLQRAIDEEDINGIFNNILLINKLSDPRGQEAFVLLKTKFKTDIDMMETIKIYEEQFNSAIKKQ